MMHNIVGMQKKREEVAAKGGRFYCPSTFESRFPRIRRNRKSFPLDATRIDMISRERERELCPIPSRGHFRYSGISPFSIPGSRDTTG
jgi:hypothetical protein